MRVHNIMQFLCRMEKPYKTWPSKENAEIVNAVINDHVVLDPGRAVATVAKMLVDRGETQLAGVLVQILGSGVPYEIEGGSE